MRFFDRSGLVYGRWTVLTFEGRTNSGMSRWKCRCECGAEKIVQGDTLSSGDSKSCGCWKKQQAFIHKMTNHPTYWVYNSAKDRCNLETNSGHHNYGGRGIQFNFASFEEFWKELGSTYEYGLTLERIDNNGHYEVGNVRWATRLDQGKNKRNNKFLTYKGETKIASEWARSFNTTAQQVKY